MISIDSKLIISYQNIGLELFTKAVRRNVSILQGRSDNLHLEHINMHPGVIIAISLILYFVILNLNEKLC